VILNSFECIDAYIADQDAFDNALISLQNSQMTLSHSDPQKSPLLNPDSSDWLMRQKQQDEQDRSNSEEGGKDEDEKREEAA
jgi:hypothetical protein